MSLTTINSTMATFASRRVAEDVCSAYVRARTDPSARDACAGLHWRGAALRLGGYVAVRFGSVRFDAACRVVVLVCFGLFYLVCLGRRKGGGEDAVKGRKEKGRRGVALMDGSV